MEFFRFPHTPHLAWLGDGRPRQDKVLTPAEADELLAHRVTVEEKVDGANVGFSIDRHGDLRAQNRGAYIDLAHAPKQFRPLAQWLDVRRDALAEALGPALVAFGEWCYATHSVHYTRLPDWFLLFDVYDRVAGRFWSVARRNDWAERLGLAVVPLLGSGTFALRDLVAMLGPSKLAEGPAEGLYVRRDDGDHLVARAKLVRAEFVQSIGPHWSSRSLRPNALAAQGQRPGRAFQK